MMNGKRSVQRCLDQETQESQDNSSVRDNSSKETTGSGGTQPKSWYLHNYTRGCPRTSTTSSSQGEENGRDSSNRGQIMFSREAIATESSSNTSYNSSAASEQSLLKTICSIPCLVVFSMICLLQNLLQSCISVRNQMTMVNCMRSLKLLTIAGLVICGTIYIFCQYQQLSNITPSKELTELYETELKALWKSQNVLQEQIHEIQNLKKETDRLHSEISSINKGILQSVKQILQKSEIPEENKDQVLDMMNLALKKIYEDHVQMADWALKTIGATIDEDRTSKTYNLDASCWFKSLFISSANPPDTILQPDVYPGNCWAFEGSEGQTVIKLPIKIQPMAVTVQHISKAVSVWGEVSSALKDFLVYGINEETKEEILLGSFTYDIEKEFIQTFQLQNEQEMMFQYIKFKVLTNWGNPAFTCIYRIRVHGINMNLFDQGRGLNLA